MTEREILKKLVEGKLDEAFRAAQELLDDSPKPEHPAVAAYRKWCTSKADIELFDAAFLAGWKQALEWAAGQRRGLVHAQDFAVDLSAYAHATPEHLP